MHNKYSETSELYCHSKCSFSNQRRLYEPKAEIIIFHLDLYSLIAIPTHNDIRFHGLDGYDIRLTRERSRVRSSMESMLFFSPCFSCFFFHKKHLPLFFMSVMCLVFFWHGSDKELRVARSDLHSGTLAREATFFFAVSNLTPRLPLFA